jgi:endonuclease/exonuclease/phosphatase family metal-dependent hydrolase
MKSVFARKLPISLAVLLLALSTVGCPQFSTPNGSGEAGDYLFCFWNVENLFDDQNDGRENKADKEFDSWFASDPAALRLKLDHLSEALIAMNGGRGPDIIALAEVETVRAAELLQQSLNGRLSDPALQYSHVLMKTVAAGRHIGTALLTRLPVKGNRTKLLGSRLRILETHIEVNDQDLVVVASHWTSRMTDKQGDHRAKYGKQIYGAYHGMYLANPKVDFLVCGDFNDPPDAESVVENLHAMRSREAVLDSREFPLLFNLFAGKDPANGSGTHFYGNAWHIFDQIAVSPGLLDNEGWACDPDSVQVVNSLTNPRDKKGRPWKFGSEHNKAARGYSDHFPVTVRLRVQGTAAASAE